MADFSFQPGWLSNKISLTFVHSLSLSLSLIPFAFVFYFSVSLSLSLSLYRSRTLSPSLSSFLYLWPSQGHKNTQCTSDFESPGDFFLSKAKQIMGHFWGFFAKCSTICFACEKKYIPDFQNQRYINSKKNLLFLPSLVNYPFKFIQTLLMCFLLIYQISETL